VAPSCGRDFEKAQVSTREVAFRQPTMFQIIVCPPREKLIKGWISTLEPASSF
jgi:hypothetical protein